MRCRRHMLILLHSYDVDYPLEVDDEFWDTGDPATDFVQPDDRPSRISVFVCLLKLVKVINRSMKVIVSGRTLSVPFILTYCFAWTSIP
jgi:hypothetical protein